MQLDVWNDLAKAKRRRTEKKRVERPGESQEASDGKKSKSLALKWCAQPIQKAR